MADHHRRVRIANPGRQRAAYCQHPTGPITAPARRGAFRTAGFVREVWCRDPHTGVQGDMGLMKLRSLLTPERDDPGRPWQNREGLPNGFCEASGFGLAVRV